MVDTVAHWIGTALARDAGLRTAFGVPGPGNAQVISGLTANGAAFVAARHEGGAAAMADAYARVSGEVGLLTVGAGAGLTGALTSLAEAAKSRTPLLVLAAEDTSPLSGRHVDQAALAAAVGLIPDRVTAASTVVNDLRRAHRTALIERRTVLLSLPLPVQAQLFPDVPLPAVRIWPRLSPAQETVTAVADALAAAERPVFLAGRGARQARQELKQLAERAGALVATSTAARGLFRGDPFDLDLSGSYATPVAAGLLRAADLVIAWGCALSPWTTRGGTGNASQISPGATVIQVDANPAALGLHRRVDLGIPSDAGTAARAVLAELASREQRAQGYRTPEVAKQLAAEGRWRDIPFAPATEENRIDPRILTIALDDLLPAQRTVAVDAGDFMACPVKYLSVPDENGLVFTQAFQSAGLGLATGIGAAVARPARLTVAALSTAGALKGASELETAARLGLGNLLVIVYDEGGVTEADFAALARGFGYAAATVRPGKEPGKELAAVQSWLDCDRGRPLLVDAKVAQLPA